MGMFTFNGGSQRQPEESILQKAENDCPIPEKAVEYSCLARARHYMIELADIHGYLSFQANSILKDAMEVLSGQQTLP